MQTRSQLLLPPKQLASCIAVAVFRDTRGVTLPDEDRFNYFPASPLVSLTHVISGELRLVQEVGSLEAARQAEPLPEQCAMPPQTAPVISWSPGPIAAVTIGFYPDAWVKLRHGSDDNSIPNALANALTVFNSDLDICACWTKFNEALTPTWDQLRAAGGLPDWAGSDRLFDYARHLLGRAATATPGRSIRTLERRLKHWTGQTGQSLSFYAVVEDLHRRTVKSPDTPLAGLAHDAGFADQSHMGRTVRRATGFSPARLNHLIKTEESFWCYRLMGERF